MSLPASKVILAEARGQVVGLLSYSIRPDLYHAGNSCLIEELIVQETFRGQGVGSALMTELFTRLAYEDCVEVSVTTMADNTPAIQFYRSQDLTDDAVYLEKHFQLDTGGT
jgi:ribosomal protein S18 acetylase RimI-like enzyme